MKDLTHNDVQCLVDAFMNWVDKVKPKKKYKCVKHLVLQK